jgi:hypothetical protein
MRWFDSNGVGYVLGLVSSEALDVFDQQVEEESVRWRRNESEMRAWTGGHEKTRAIKNAAAAAIPPIKVV